MMQWEQAKGFLSALTFLAPELSASINSFITVLDNKIREDFNNAKREKELDSECN